MTDKGRPGDKYRGIDVDYILPDDLRPVPGPRKPRFRDDWSDVEHELDLLLPPVDYFRDANRRMAAQVRQPDRVERFVQICIKHQVAISLAVWALIVGGGLLIWLRW